MDASLINSDTIDLMSRLTGQKLRQQDLSPPLVFMAALLSVLAGVMFADGKVTNSEKQRWQATLARLAPSGSELYQFVKILNKSIHALKIYNNIYEILGLVGPLSDSEKLLLFGLGYQMSAADGEIDASEKQYLEDAAHWMWIDSRYLAVLEAGFSQRAIADVQALEEVYSLLDPARFQSLDSLFVSAASEILEVLPARPKRQRTKTKQRVVSSYEDLKKFQESRKQLNAACDKLFQVVKNCTNRNFLPHTFNEEIGKISKKLQTQCFRLATIGEFSKGKSTLLNAILGEEIQPVRAIACSGTIAILKYGDRKRVVCRLKNGSEEEIPLEQYKIKTTISEEAALDGRIDELANSQIEEIIFEHPDLQLCRHGVEIVDSPGLNEHPDRTRITLKLLENTDAVIFMTSALQILTQGEQDLLQDLRTRLNGGNKNEPANNIFVVVNFMDNLRTDKDRQQVRQRVENFVMGKNPIIQGENRIHFISAQAALDAILTGIDNDYLEKLDNFTQSLEKFLTTECGSIKIKRSVSEIEDLMQKTVSGLHQAEDVLEGKIKISESAKQEILEQIGEASGRDIRIQNIADAVVSEAIEEASESWQKWLEKLGDCMAEKSAGWHSKHSHIWSQKELIQDYAKQFVRDLQREIDAWGDSELREAILQPKLNFLDKFIRQELEALKQNLQSIDRQINTNFSRQVNFRISGIEGDMGGAGGVMGGIGAGGALAAGLLAFTGIGLIPIVIAAIAAAIAGGFGLGLLDVDGIHDQIKIKVMELGFQKFEESMDGISERFEEIVGSAFGSRLEAASEEIAQIISYYENILEQQEKVHQETVARRQAEKAWIAQQHQELDRVQKEIEAILNQ